MMDISNRKPQDFVFDFINLKSKILFLIFSPNGRIFQGNEFARKRFGDPIDQKTYKDIFVAFPLPETFSEFLSSHSPEKAYSISDLSNIPETFYFHFEISEEKIYAIGERNAGELASAQIALLRLNTENSSLSRELYKKNSELKQLDEIKNRLLGIAAHDLRGPAGVILGFCELLQEQLTPDSAGLEFLSEIRGCAEFQLRLVSDVLDYSKIEAGKIDLKFRMVDISAILEDNLKFHRLLSRKKEIIIENFFEKGLPHILADPTRITQVLNNLISNAIKYSFEKGKITVRLSRVSEEFQIAVEDQGPGIPEKELNLLFKPFSRTSVRPTAGEPSSGLGLAIARKIILEHHGRIWVESQLGKGTIFTFTLPIRSN
ncbi:MAG: HAMP domain-containing histidine kinase [Candidatus Riflebacteria bacterium]|nr:HAMP domain-containing histidine kinase [Candidatus Riflebacteria bacterium]